MTIVSVIASSAGKMSNLKVKKIHFAGYRELPRLGHIMARQSYDSLGQTPRSWQSSRLRHGNIISQRALAWLASCFVPWQSSGIGNMAVVEWNAKNIKSHVRKFLKSVTLHKLREILRNLNEPDVSSEAPWAHESAETAILQHLMKAAKLPVDVLGLESISEKDIIKYLEDQYEAKYLLVDKLGKYTHKQLVNKVLKLWQEV